MNKNSVFCIAEMSANHNRSLERAKDIVRAAARCGADAVKLQTYTADTLTLDCTDARFMAKGALWAGRNLYDLYKEASMPWEWTSEIMKLARDLDMDCFSTPCDVTAVDFLEQCGVSRYKITSFDVVNVPLLKRVAQTGKPVILSTGMANLGEIDEAVHILRDNGTQDLTLLKCTSAYPASPEEVNLRTIPHMATAFGCHVGLSDHTLGSAVAVAAVAVGATVLEKHFTLARADGGPDSAFSMEPDEFRQMVHDIRVAEKALGTVSYTLTGEQKRSVQSRPSLCIVKNIAEGQPFTAENVKCIRPGGGLHSRYFELILGKKATCNLSAGTPLLFEHVLEG